MSTSHFSWCPPTNSHHRFLTSPVCRMALQENPEMEGLPLLSSPSRKCNHRDPIIWLPCSLTPTITKSKTRSAEERLAGTRSHEKSKHAQPPGPSGFEETIWITYIEDSVTFLILLHDGRRGRRHLHGQPIGSSEGVAITDNEGPGLLVLQESNGWGRQGVGRIEEIRN